MPNKKSKDSKLPARSSRSSITAKQVSQAVANALRTVYPRLRAMDDYSTSLQKADEKVTGLIEEIIQQTHWTYRTAVWLYIATYIMSLLAVIAGVYLAVFQNTSSKMVTLSTVCIGGGVITLIFLLNRNPLKNIRYLVNNLFKLNILLAGYNHQLQQIDVNFKNLYASGTEVDPSAIEEMLKHIQDAGDEAINAISQKSDEIVE